MNGWTTAPVPAALAVLAAWCVIPAMAHSAGNDTLAHASQEGLIARVRELRERVALAEKENRDLAKRLANIESAISVGKSHPTHPSNRRRSLHIRMPPGSRWWPTTPAITARRIWVRRTMASFSPVTMAHSD